MSAASRSVVARRMRRSPLMQIVMRNGARFMPGPPRSSRRAIAIDWSSYGQAGKTVPRAERGFLVASFAAVSIRLTLGAPVRAPGGCVPTIWHSPSSRSTEAEAQPSIKDGDAGRLHGPRADDGRAGVTGPHRLRGDRAVIGHLFISHEVGKCGGWCHHCERRNRCRIDCRLARVTVRTPPDCQPCHADGDDDAEQHKLLRVEIVRAWQPVHSPPNLIL